MTQDASRMGLAFMPETTWGVIPATALQDLRYTSESLRFGVSNVSSDEIRGDGQITDITQVGQDTSGSVEFELSYTTFDEFLEAALRSDFGTAEDVSITDVILADATGGVFSFTKAGELFPVVKGQWIHVSGCSNSENNGFFKVAATNATGDAINVYDVDGDMVPSATEDPRIQSVYLANGTTKKSFVMEKSFPDTTDTSFITFAGMRVGEVNLAFRTQDKLTGSISFQGKSATAQGTSQGTGGNTTATTTRVLNASSHFASLLVDGAPITGTFIRELDLNINNNLRQLPAIGQIDNIDIGYGRFLVSGSMLTYFANRTLYEKYLNATELALDLVVQDPDGNGLAFNIESLVLTDGDVVNEGNDTDILARLDWQAKINATTSKTLQISKLPAA